MVDYDNQSIMKFIEELENDLIIYEKVYREIKINRVFTNEESMFIYRQILIIKELLEIIKK